MTRKEKATKIAMETMDRILSTDETRDAVMITGTIGGDVITYKIYDNGMVTEK